MGEEPLEIEQQLDFPQEKDLDIEIEINEECQKQELNEELNADGTNSISLVNECKDEFEEDRAMKTPELSERSLEEPEAQSDSDEEDIWSSINKKFKEIKHKQLQLDSCKNRKTNLKTATPILDSLNSSFESSPPELKDEFMGEAS